MKRVALWVLVGLILSMAVLSCSASGDGERAKRPARRDCDYDDHDDCDDEYEVAYGYGKSWGACEDDDDCPPIALILDLEEQEGGDDSCWEEDDDDECTWPTLSCLLHLRDKNSPAQHQVVVVIAIAIAVAMTTTVVEVVTPANLP
jgi:hypothetical protein